MRLPRWSRPALVEDACSERFTSGILMVCRHQPTRAVCGPWPRRRRMTFSIGTRVSFYGKNYQDLPAAGAGESIQGALTIVHNHSEHDLTHDLVLPTLLFGAIGGMTWAVRGCSGYGASAGCIFAGVTLGTAWWFIARDPKATQSRRYASGWIILAMTIAFGIAGNRGWMQWPHFFNNTLYINYSAGESVPISRTYGFVWTFLAGIPWAGLGACGLAWCASGRRTSAWQWLVRLSCGIGMAYVLSVFLYNRFPEVFLPLYDSLKGKYEDLETNRSLWKLVRDNREAMIQMGLYLGFLMYEVARRDWKNVTLIVTVGLLNGVGWALLQNWTWASKLWPGAQFNFWRCWESSAGISIGVAYGVAYYLVNRRMTGTQPASQGAAAGEAPPSLGWVAAFIVTVLLIGLVSFEVMPIWCASVLTLVAAVFAIAYYVKARKATQEAGVPHGAAWSPYGPNLERWGAYTGLILGLGLSIKNGLKGWANIYLGNEGYWNNVFMNIIGPLIILGMAAISAWVILRPRPAGQQDDTFPRAYGLLWLVLLVQNTLALLITGPLTNWNEVAFSIYYVLLFIISAVIVCHFHFVKTYRANERSVLVL